MCTPPPHTADPLSLLVDDALVASWTRQGLPSDPTSVQNGTILTNSERWPLMMDPQLQGVVWIKERESKNNLQVGITWLHVAGEPLHTRPSQHALSGSLSASQQLALLCVGRSPVRCCPNIGELPTQAMDNYHTSIRERRCCHYCCCCRLFAWVRTTC